MTYFSFCKHHAEVPQTETCQAPHLNSSHNNPHNLYCDMQSIWIQVEHTTVLACIVYVTGITSFLLHS